MSEITNVMTVDVEDYFQVSAFEGKVLRNEWDEINSRVEINTRKVLDLFSNHNIKATFFVLAWIAERFPELIKRIVNEGHELASHGYDHTRITQFSPDEFRQDIIKSKNILEGISGHTVIGYRAPSYSINKSNLWAHQILEECGYKYSSSIYPVKHDLYGIPDAPRFKYLTSTEGLIEFPITTIKVLNSNIPCGGGGFFRLYPYFVSKWAINRVNNIDKQPGIFYFHPWEIDTEQPRLPNLPIKTRIRHYLNLNKMEGRLIKLFNQFNWTRMDSYI